MTSPWIKKTATYDGGTLSLNTHQISKSSFLIFADALGRVCAPVQTPELSRVLETLKDDMRQVVKHARF